MQPINWTRHPVQPDDILDALKSIEGRTIWTHSLTPEGWQLAETLYHWAEVGLNNDNEPGWDIAVSYAKRAVCRRIDGFLLNNWSGHLLRLKNPAKLDYLRRIGIPIPQIVQRLVIESRNEVEHEYRSASKAEAVDAVEVAQLMLNATAGESSREPAILAGGTILASMNKKSSEPSFESHSIENLGEDPLVFVDYWETPTLVKVVYPKDHEIRHSELKNFKDEKAVDFTNRMRTFRNSDFFRRFVFAPHLDPTVVRFHQFKHQTGI